LEHTPAEICVSLELSINFEAVTAHYVNIGLERSEKFLDASYNTVENAESVQKRSVYAASRRSSIPKST